MSGDAYCIVIVQKCAHDAFVHDIVLVYGGSNSIDLIPSLLSCCNKKLLNPQSSAGSLPPSSPSLVAKREVLVLVVRMKTFY